MSQSLAKILVHVIFSTKNRVPMIGPEVRTALHAYLAGTLENLLCPSLRTGGTSDHVHSLLSLSRTRSIAEVVAEMKMSSSKWMKQQGVRGFAWQAGYGAFSVSESQATTVIRYVGRQEEHHRVMSFQEEFRRLLDRCRVPYDERYVWN